MLTRWSMLAAALLALHAPLAADPKPPIVPGAYEGSLLLGFDAATNKVTGYYRSSTGEGQFSCIFYFEGTLRQRTATLRSYFPRTPDEVIEGELQLKEPSSLTVRLKEEHGGCWNVQHFADPTQPAEFRQTGSSPQEQPHPWTAIKVVKGKQAHFFDAPGAKAPRKAYLVEGDGVGVRAVKDGWLQVEFPGERALTTGWMPASAFY